MRTAALLFFLCATHGSLQAEPLHERVILSAQGAAEGAEQGVPHARHARVRADRDTGPEPPGERAYEEVFRPSLFPYKRMNVFDAVLADESLAVRDQRLRPVLPDGTSASPPRGVFRGTLLLDLVPDRWVPIPSIGAGARLRAFTITPKVAVEFAIDGADNWFVRSPYGGRHQLDFTTDVPRVYLANHVTDDIPGNVRLSDEPRALLPTVPSKIRALGREVLDHLGFSPTENRFAPVLLTLVDYFRAFQVGKVGEIPPQSGSIYRDLALGKQGACRHRAFAFVLTALVAGIPARYVENELHVFVEVYVPTLGWRRVDLGGAPVHFRRRTSEERAQATPREDAARSDSRLVPTLQIELGRTTGYRGEGVEIAGSIAEPMCGELPVEIFLDGPGGAIRLGSTTTHAGRFHLATTLPRETALGDHQVIARTAGDARCAPASSQ